MYLSDNLAEGLAEAGYEVVQFTPTPSRGVSVEARRHYRRLKYEERLNGRLKIYRFSMFREGKNPIARALRYICISTVHFWKAISYHDWDVLIVGSTPPTQGAMAGLLKKIKKNPVIFILQDVFPDSLVSTGLLRKGSMLWKLGRIIEDFAYRNVDKIVVISESFKENLMEKGVPESKIEVIPNWVEEDRVVPIEKESNVLYSAYNLDKAKFTICYAGNLGHTQNLELLLDVAEELQSNENIQFVLIGDGVYKSKVEERIHSANMHNVILLPFQLYELISHVFSLGDVGLVISKGGVGQNSVPSKTWSIMAAGRPVLASFDLDSDLNSVIKEAECGICVPPDDKESLVKAFLVMFEYRVKLPIYGEKGRKYIFRNLSRKFGVSRYVALVNGMLGK